MFSSIGKLFCIANTNNFVIYSYFLLIVYLTGLGAFLVYAFKALRNMYSNVSNQKIKVSMVVVAILGIILSLFQLKGNLKPFPGGWMIHKFMLLLISNGGFPPGNLYEKLLAFLDRADGYRTMQAIAISTGCLTTLIFTCFGLTYLDHINVWFIPLDKVRRPLAFLILWLFLGLSLLEHTRAIRYLQYRNKLCSILPLTQFTNLTVPEKYEDGVALENERDIVQAFLLMQTCKATPLDQSPILDVMRRVGVRYLWNTDMQNMDPDFNNVQSYDPECQQWGMDCVEAVENFCSPEFTETLLVIIGRLFVLTIPLVAAMVLMLMTYKRFASTEAKEAFENAKQNKINLFIF